MTACAGCAEDWRAYRRLLRDARTAHAQGQPVDVVAVDMAKTLADSCTHPVVAVDPIAALLAERFGPPTPRAQKTEGMRASAAAIAELLADLDGPTSAEEVA